MPKELKSLHPKQQKLLDLLEENVDDPLTIRELQEELGLSSTSMVHHHITQLEKNGFLRRNPSNPKDYQVLAAEPEKKIIYLNLYGLAQCGPNGSLLDGDPIDRIPIATKILGFAAQDAFLVKARGDSMEPKIHAKDLVIAKKVDDVDSGSVAVCVNKGEALIKKVVKTERGTMLKSLNEKKYPPFFADEDFRIEGLVKGIISYEPTV